MIVAANEPRIAATAVISTCLKPGCHTIFESRRPSRSGFMRMSNYTNEAKFDEFVKTLTWEGHLERIRSPYLVVAGEFDGLSPLLEHNQTEWCKPRQLAIYARHSAPPEGFALKERAGAWKYPRWIAVRPDLPRTATGKIQRFKLKD